MPDKILIAPTTFSIFVSRPKELLSRQGFDIIENTKGRKLLEQEIIDLGKNCIGVIAGTENYTKDVLEKLPRLKVISRLGVGMDNINLDFAEKRSIKVYGTKTTPAPAVAELALGLILDVLRKISMQHCLLKNGKWGKMMGSLLTGRILGIIGLGAIGKQLVKLTQGFGLTYKAYDIQRDDAFAKKYNIEFCELDKLFATSDIISIHLSLSAETRQLIDYHKLKMMKPEAIIINTSRGEIINEEALVKALDEQIIVGAALDVFECEPYNGPLLRFDNVVVTPHIGAYAKEIRMNMEIEAVENLLAGLRDNERITR